VLDLDLSGLDRYLAWLTKEPERIELEVRVAFRNWAVAVHADIAKLTPQWSGNLAANWAIDIGAPTSTAQYLGDASVIFQAESKDSIYGREPYSRGMQPAVSIALARGKAVGVPSLRDTFYIHNPVTYAEEVEEDSGPRRIRAINRIPRSETGKIAMVAHAYTKHSQTKEL
jgi:hypothetical protein